MRRYRSTIHYVSKPIVFVSCGQFTEAERALGKEICQLITEETPYSAYFAEQQSTFDGLINNIFATLAKSSALIAVMHHRGNVQTPEGTVARASVWVEQEVAISAFIHHILKRPLSVALYLQRGISLEGARQQLLLGPTIFDSSIDIVSDLRSRVKSWQLVGAGRKSLIATWQSYRTSPPETDRHEHVLEVNLVNNGLEKIDEWKVEIWFPAEFLDLFDYREDLFYQYDSDTNYSSVDRRIWPGSEPRNVFNLHYHIDNNNWPLRLLWPGEKRSERFARIRVQGGDEIWEENIPMIKLQDF